MDPQELWPDYTQPLAAGWGVGQNQGTKRKRSPRLRKLLMDGGYAKLAPGKFEHHAVSQIVELRPIVVYLIEQHPLEAAGNTRFRWLAEGDSRKRYLEALLGTYDPDQLSLIIDKHPAGPAWRELLRGLIDERVKMVITHLAPLSSAQRQLLIGLCADTGAQLITPGDGGRNNPDADIQRSI